MKSGVVMSGRHQCLLRNRLIATVAAIDSTIVSTIAIVGSDAPIGDLPAKADVAVSETNVVAMKILNIWSVPFSFRGSFQATQSVRCAARNPSNQQMHVLS
jgi:hypothetical protein